MGHYDVVDSEDREAPARRLSLTLATATAGPGFIGRPNGIAMVSGRNTYPSPYGAGWTGEIEHPALGVDFGCPTASAAGVLSLGT